MRKLILITAASTLVACAQAPSYQYARSTQQIIALQTLDAEAPVNNDGVTRELQADYARHAAENYRNSVYTGKEGRNVKTQDSKGR